MCVTSLLAIAWVGCLSVSPTVFSRLFYRMSRKNSSLTGNGFTSESWSTLLPCLLESKLIAIWLGRARPTPQASLLQPLIVMKRWMMNPCIHNPSPNCTRAPSAKEDRQSSVQSAWAPCWSSVSAVLIASTQDTYRPVQCALKVDHVFYRSKFQFCEHPHSKAIRLDICFTFLSKLTTGPNTSKISILLE